MKKWWQKFEKRRRRWRRFRFSAKCKTSYIILGSKLWPVGFFYEINYGKKVIEIFNPEDKCEDYQVSQLFFSIKMLLLLKL